MTVQIRCREDRNYKFVFATPKMEEHGLAVLDREDTEHFFPFENLIHVSMKHDPEPDFKRNTYDPAAYAGTTLWQDVNK